MKVFISWSGERSLKVAEILKEWIPCIIQGIEPYLSSADIVKGARWSIDIAQELEIVDFGILCVTKDNLNSSWLNFEAGALSKAVDKANVCPFLFDLKPSDISNSPILQFQMTNVDRDDVYKLFQSMNSCIKENGLSDELLKKMFDLSWPNIDKALKEIEVIQSNETAKKEESDELTILEEVLSLLRSQQILLRDPSQLLPSEYINSILGNGNEKYSQYIKEQISDKMLAERKMLELEISGLLINGTFECEGVNEPYKKLRVLFDRYTHNTDRILAKLGLISSKKLILRTRPKDETLNMY